MVFPPDAFVPATNRPLPHCVRPPTNEIPNPFHRDDLATPDDVRCGQHRIMSTRKSARRFGRIVGRCFGEVAGPQFHLRAAHRTSVGLRMEAAVVRVIVFRLTFRTHAERLHRRLHAIVRKGFDDAGNAAHSWCSS